MKYKIRIKKAPTTMAYGGQTPNYALDLGQRQFNDFRQPDETTHINNTLTEVPRHMANIEAEVGETAIGDFDQDGMLEHMKIPGKRHSQGGTALNVPPGTFIYSDTKTMRMGGEELKQFGKSGKKKYTPAELAKQYELQKYKAILNDPYADSFSKKTAELMMANNQNKLGVLALMQESKKGFPQGIPAVAQPLMEQANLAEAAYGGYVLPKALYGYDFPPTDEYSGGKTVAGSYTPTQILNKFSRGNDFYTNWEKVIPGIRNMPNRKAQDLMYEYMLKNNPQAIENMWKTYGLTNQGKKYKDLVGLTSRDANGRPTYKFDPSKSMTPAQLKSLKNAYVDGMFGVRQMDPTATPPPATPPPSNPPANPPDIVPPPSVTTPPPGNPVDNTQYICTPNGVQAISGDHAANFVGVSGPRGAVYSTYEEALAACVQPETPQQQTPPGAPPKQVTPPPGINVGEFDPKGSNVPFEYLTPDKLSTASAARTYLNRKKYMPWEAPVEGYMATPSFLNPDRELAYNSEQANTQSMMNAMFSGPQSLGARNARVQGMAADNAANTLGKINNQNVGLANEFSMNSAQFMNQLAQAKAARATRLFDKTTIANQQYDNERDAAFNEMVKSGINAYNNRSKTYADNVSHKYFMIDPRTGKMVQKTSVNPFSPNFRPSSRGTASSAIDWDKYEAEALRLKKLGLNDAAIKTIVDGKFNLGKVNATNPYTNSRYTGMANMRSAYGPAALDDDYDPYD